MAAVSQAVVALERRLARALGTHTATPAERSRIQAAFGSSSSWETLPASIRQLVEEIERRPTL